MQRHRCGASNRSRCYWTAPLFSRCIFVNGYLYLYEYVYVCIYIHIYTYMHMYVYTNTFIYVYIYAYIYIYYAKTPMRGVKSLQMVLGGALIGPPVYQCGEHWSGGPGSLVRGAKEKLSIPPIGCPQNLSTKSCAQSRIKRVNLCLG